jgi:hypothetical protein
VFAHGLTLFGVQPFNGLSLWRRLQLGERGVYLHELQILPAIKLLMPKTEMPGDAAASATSPLMPIYQMPGRRFYQTESTMSAYKAWPLWRTHGSLGGRWELEVFGEDGGTVLERLPLNELLNKTDVRALLDQMVAEANLPPQPSKFELLSEPSPARRKAGAARP